MNLKAQAIVALCFGAILALSFCPTARAIEIEILSGPEYFATQPGTEFSFGSYGTINLMGVPFGPGNTDTIVERLSQAPVSPGGTIQIPIEIVALSMESTQPLNIAGSLFNVFVTLNPAQLNNDTGQMTITANSAGTGGTFTSSLDVYFDACLQPGAQGVGCANGTSPIATGEEVLTNSGANWSMTPSPGYVSPIGDFFVQGTVTENCLPGTTPPCGPSATYVIEPAVTPEPSSLALWATGLVLVGILGKKFFTAA